MAAVGGKQEENERRPKSGATSATTWHQVQGPPWLLCDFFLDFFSPTFLCLAESSKTVLIPFVKVWEEAEEWQQLGVGRQLAAVAFVRRPFSLQLDLQLEPASTATSSPRSSNSNTRLCTRPSWPPCPTMAYSGPVIDVRVGFEQWSFPFPPPIAVSQLKVTGFKLVGSSTLSENLPAKKPITDGGSTATHSESKVDLTDGRTDRSYLES